MVSRLLRSVGIDIGTTTTQVIFSELEVVNRAPASQVPHYEFSRKEITYVSPVVFTPIEEDGRVRKETLQSFIDSQYAAAGVGHADIDSGAVIITGETSKAKNAKDTILALAESLGDFVVATAGPHLESVIAGHGSGASSYSRDHASCVLNIDIGGGTSNYAVFKAGRLIDTACLNVGGHLVETSKEGAVIRVREPAGRICSALFGMVPSAGELDKTRLNAVIQKMADLVWEVAQGRPSLLAENLLMTNSLRADHQFDEVFISGGVGECYYRPESVTNPFMFGDIGPLLAKALYDMADLSALTRHRPAQTVRATVIGAGAHTLSLSGSTIWLNASVLPMRNVPVLHPYTDWADENARGTLQADWQVAAERMDLDLTHDHYALALPEGFAPLYRQIEQIADALRQFSERYPSPHPLIVMTREDVGKALGMELQPVLKGRELAVIDEVETREGDYVDIGEAFFGGEIVPLTVKSLAFPA